MHSGLLDHLDKLDHQSYIIQTLPKPQGQEQNTGDIVGIGTEYWAYIRNRNIMLCIQQGQEQNTGHIVGIGTEYRAYSRNRNSIQGIQQGQEQYKGHIVGIGTVYRSYSRDRNSIQIIQQVQEQNIRPIVGIGTECKVKSRDRNKIQDMEAVQVFVRYQIRYGKLRNMKGRLMQIVENMRVKTVAKRYFIVVQCRTKVTQKNVKSGI